MRVDELMQELVGGELEDEETECLRRLTHQGMAKLNSDVVRGVDPETILTTFRQVYQASKQRREATIRSLPKQALALLAQMDRLVSTNEMVFLHDCCVSGVIEEMIDENGVLSKRFDLKECGNMYLHDKLCQDALHLMTGTGLSIIPCQLAATVCPQDLTAPHFIQSRGNNSNGCGRMILQISPSVSWFHESMEDPIEVSPDAANSILSDGGSLCTDDDWSDPEADEVSVGKSSSNSIGTTTSAAVRSPVTVGSSSQRGSGGGPTPSRSNLSMKSTRLNARTTITRSPTKPKKGVRFAVSDAKARPTGLAAQKFPSWVMESSAREPSRITTPTSPNGEIAWISPSSSIGSSSSSSSSSSSPSTPTVTASTKPTTPTVTKKGGMFSSSKRSAGGSPPSSSPSTSTTSSSSSSPNVRHFFSTVLSKLNVILPAVSNPFADSA